MHVFTALYELSYCLKERLLRKNYYTLFSSKVVVVTIVITVTDVPRENGSRTNDWIRNRIIFILFYSIYKKDTKLLRNLI